jgi:hypothetical protein
MSEIIFKEGNDLKINNIKSRNVIIGINIIDLINLF